MHKSRIGALAAISALAITLSACGGANTGSTPAPGGSAAPATSDEKITLTVATFNEFGYDSLFAEYTKAHPNITITPSEMTADFRVVATALEQTSTVRTDFTDVVPDRDPVVLPVDTPTTTTSTPTDDGDATPATPVPGSASYTG